MQMSPQKKTKQNLQLKRVSRKSSKNGCLHPEKKSSAPKKPKNVEGGDDGSDAVEQDNNEPEEEFDKEKYLNQPLNKKEGERIHGYSTDWESVSKNFRTDAVGMIKSLASDIVEYAQDKEDAKV